ncbi:MAG: aminopeptidase, partial [Ketobacteraceae bacterium]|nr:aminopeptidase [Ketobacteraceae bacterium]
PEELKHKLRLVQEIRAFAGDALQLPVNSSYSQYADLERPYAVWNVFAAPEFSVKPETWCYPIAGCVSYKGYFDESDAREYARELAQEGYDVYVGGVAAYSTLGWFEDPVLNTFVTRPDPALAALLIHELAHRQLYVSGDSAFNESFATTVEILGLEQWLTSNGMPEQVALIATHRERKDQFVDLILAHREALETLYASDLPEAAMRDKKSLMKQRLKDQYAALKARWGGYGGYDAWFEGPLNNAQLATIATYHHWVDSFTALYHHHQGDWSRFYEACAEIAGQNQTVREQTLEKLSVEGARFRL